MAVSDARMNRRAFTALGAGAAVVAATVGTRHGVLAQDDATPGAEDAGMPPLPEGATVVAEGL